MQRCMKVYNRGKCGTSNLKIVSVVAVKAIIVAVVVNQSDCNALRTSMLYPSSRVV